MTFGTIMCKIDDRAFSYGKLSVYFVALVIDRLIIHCNNANFIEMTFY